MSENELFRTSLSKAMTLCSHREYCIEDMRGKLLSWGVRDNDTDKIISFLAKENFINDLRYAKAFVKDKFTFNKWGKVKIVAHLKTKQIQPDIIKQALESIANERYIEVIKETIFGHRKFIKAKNHYDLKAKLLRYGLSKGFESSLLYDILNRMEE